MPWTGVRCSQQCCGGSGWRHRWWSDRVAGGGVFRFRNAAAPVRPSARPPGAGHHLLAGASAAVPHALGGIA